MSDGKEAISTAGETTRDMAVPVFFLSDSTGISAETMGNALLIQFPDRIFDRTLIPFIATIEEARNVVARLDAAMDGPVQPLAFMTAAQDDIREELMKSRCQVMDFFGMHMGRVEELLDERGARIASKLHGVNDIKRYNNRMAAIEYAIEHDDGQSMRALDKAQLILLAPSRCGKTPTTMFLALQYGIFVANYPLVEEDFDTTELPRPVRHLRDRCFGITTTVARLSQVRQERRGSSRYASPEQCSFEIRQSEAMFRAHRIPMINSSAKSVEEMSAVILQSIASRTPKDQQR